MNVLICKNLDNFETKKGILKRINGGQ